MMKKTVSPVSYAVKGLTRRTQISLSMQRQKEVQRCGGTRSVRKNGVESETGEIDIAKCWTGKSKSGYCGAAAYCDKEFTCCVMRGERCNSQCGWLDEKEV